MTAREVLEFWKLDAELVTLSACETALGRSGGGDGQLGFAQAFLTAGSRSVCLSLWKVDDSATALLMDRFYQNLTGKREGLNAPLGKADALAEAKTWLRNLSLEEATERLGTITDGVARGKDQPAGKTAVREVPSGKLGVVFDKTPAPEAIASRRKADELLFSARGEEWKELPGTRIELARLADLFGKDKITVLADANATEPALDALRTADRLKEFRYLHFATHGEANQLSAFQSQLILVQDRAAREAVPRAGQPTLDGKLTAHEVLEFWKLDAELVTLSACETALGRNSGGDGQLGFAQAFLTAGSHSVCLSLWKVDDSATALLMDRFYQNLTGKRDGLKAPMGKADALAEAKMWLRNLSLEEATQRLGTISDGVARGKDQPALKVVPPVAEPKANPKEVKPFAHPRYWAAFVLIGDPN